MIIFIGNITVIYIPSERLPRLSFQRPKCLDKGLNVLTMNHLIQKLDQLNSKISTPDNIRISGIPESKSGKASPPKVSHKNNALRRLI